MTRIEFDFRGSKKLESDSIAFSTIRPSASICAIQKLSFQ